MMTRPHQDLTPTIVPENRWVRSLAFALPLLAATLVLSLVSMVNADPAEARGGRRGNSHVSSIVVRTPAYHLGFGYGRLPYFGRYGFYGAAIHRPNQQPEGGLNLQIARVNGWGALDIDVKPRKAEVWVDGKFVAQAGDLDGQPAYLWLDEGRHVVTIYKGGFQTYEQVFGINAGQVTQVKFKMAPGQSEPPGGSTSPGS